MGRRKSGRIKCGKKGNAVDAPSHSKGAMVDNDEELPYKVNTSEILGRYLMANRSLKAGEIIMTDEAIAVGPCQESIKPVCIGCYVNIDLDNKNSFKRCNKCGWPLCSENCSGIGKRLGHSEQECTTMKESSIKVRGISEIRHCFYALMPLRLLLLKSFDTKTWEVVQGMEAHTAIRQRDLNLWQNNKEMAVDKIHNVFGLSKFTADEIHFACGVLEVNAFEVNISPMMEPLRAIYTKACLFSHDCVPNTSHSNGADFSLIVRTTGPIPKNSLLTISYTYTLQSTLKRRNHLLKTKFFSCSCKRCSDVTEFGVYCSAVKCQKCKTGTVLPTSPLDSASDWQCKNCLVYKIPVSAINELCDRLSEELDAVNGNDIIGYEHFLRQYENVLHENHYLRLSALHCLFQIYGKVDGYLINELSEVQLQRKIQICRHLIKIFEKLEPGLSKQRGIILYELQAPLMILLRQKFEQNRITKKEIRQKLREVIKCLEESWKILSMESEHSVEGQIANAAKEALESTKCWDSIVEMM